MNRIQNNIFQLDRTDIQYDNMGTYIIIEDYIDCSITQNNQIINPVILYHNENNQVEEGFKHIYLQYNEDTTSSNSSFNYSQYKIIINCIASRKNKNFIIKKNNQDEIESPPVIIKFFNELFNNNINLMTNNIIYRENDLYQNVDMPNEDDKTYTLIKIANVIVYNKEAGYFSDSCYIPLKNNKLQKIFVKIASDDLIANPPVAVQMQIYTPSSSYPLFQIKSKINAAVENYKYTEGYGFQYGSLLDQNINNTAKIYSNQFGYYSDEYVFEWTFNEEQALTIMNLYQSNPKMQLIFRCRYAVKSINEKYIWNGWSPEIKNIIINTPPLAPTEIKLKEIPKTS